MTLLPGDVFCVHGNMGVVSWGIRSVERFHSRDNEATYGHSGIILDRNGNTFEQLWTATTKNISQYIGSKLIVARPTNSLNENEIDESKKLLCMRVLQDKHKGQFYPVHRLALHLIPPAAKYVSCGSRVVCSELVAKYLYNINARHAVYTGVSPDTLADEWHHWSNYDIIFEDTLCEDSLSTLTNA